MEYDKQLESHNNSEGSKSINDSVQFNVLVSKTTKKRFMAFCLENDLIVKDAAEKALLEFINTYNTSQSQHVQKTK